jgi:hypothetical protein
MALQINIGGTARSLTSAERIELARALGALPTPINHSTAIPLDGNYVMAQYTIAGATSYTATNLIAGGSCVLRLLANGSNAPVLPGIEWSTSDGFDNTQAGKVNVVKVWSDDGANVYHSIGQPATSAPAQGDTTAPTYVSAATTGGTNKIIVTFSESLASTITGAVTLGGPSRTVSSQTVVGNTVEIVVSANYANGDAPTISYPANWVRDAAGNPVVASGVRSVTLASGAVTGVVTRLSSLTNMTESGDGTAGWGYVGGGAATSAYSGYGISTVSLPIDGEGYFEYRQPASGGLSTAFIGIKTGGAATVKTNFKHGTQPIAGTRYAPQTDGVSITGNGTIVIPANGDIVRIRRAIISTGVAEAYLEVSQNNRASWILCHTWTGALAGQVYGGLVVTNDPNIAMDFRSGGAA